MIWLYVIIPILILIVIAIVTDKKNKGLNSPPDVNKGNQNIEAETTRFQHYNNTNGGDSGGPN